MATDPLFASEVEARAVVGLLGLADPRVTERLENHLVEYGELLITVLLGDLAKEAFAESVGGELVRCVNWLLIVGSPSVRNVLLTGFVEGVPLDVDEARVRQLPNPLRNQVQRDLGQPQT
jgi:hypothetical protein